MNLLTNKIQTEKKKKNKDFDKIKNLEFFLLKIIHAKSPNKLQSALKEIYKIHVVDKLLHEIRKEILKDYSGEIEMIGKLSVGDQIRTTHIRVRNFTDSKAYINAIDEGYDVEDSFVCLYL